MVAYLTNPGCWLHYYEDKSMQVWGGKNCFLTAAHDWIHDCIQDLHPRLDPEVGSSLEYEESVTQLLPEIISMLSGGMAGRFSRALPRKPSSSVKHDFLAPISSGPCAFSLPSFWVESV